MGRPWANAGVAKPQENAMEISEATGVPKRANSMAFTLADVWIVENHPDLRASALIIVEFFRVRRATRPRCEPLGG